MRGTRGRRGHAGPSFPARPSAAAQAEARCGVRAPETTHRTAACGVTSVLMGLVWHFRKKKNDCAISSPPGDRVAQRVARLLRAAGRSRRPRLSQERAAPWSRRRAAPRGALSGAGRLSPACHRRAAHADTARALEWGPGASPRHPLPHRQETGRLCPRASPGVTTGAGTEPGPTPAQIN